MKVRVRSRRLCPNAGMIQEKPVNAPTFGIPPEPSRCGCRIPSAHSITVSARLPPKMMHHSRCREMSFRVGFTGRKRRSHGWLCRGCRTVSAASRAGVGEGVDPVNNVRREGSKCARGFGFGRPSNITNRANSGRQAKRSRRSVLIQQHPIVTGWEW